MMGPFIPPALHVSLPPMQVKPAEIADADAAIDVIRRSIQQLCELDHQNNPATLSMWLGNKTADNMRRSIADHTVFVAVESERIAGVASVRADGHVPAELRGAGGEISRRQQAPMQAIEAWGASRGLEWLTLNSSATALRFYLSNGWTMAGPPQPGFGVTMRHPIRKAVVAASAG